MGALLYVENFRDGMLIGSRHPNVYLAEILDILGCIVYEWDLPEHELKHSIIADAKLENELHQRDPKKLIEDLAFALAFRENGIGSPLYRYYNFNRGVEGLKCFLDRAHKLSNHGLIATGYDAEELINCQEGQIAFKGPRSQLPPPMMLSQSAFHSGEERVEIESESNYLLISFPSSAGFNEASLFTNYALTTLLDTKSKIPYGTSNSYLATNLGGEFNSDIKFSPFYKVFSTGGLIGLLMEAPKHVSLKEPSKRVIEILKDIEPTKEQLLLAKEYAIMHFYKKLEDIEKRTKYFGKMVLAGHENISQEVPDISLDEIKQVNHQF
jgi:hypothetical protein